MTKITKISLPLIIFLSLSALCFADERSKIIGEWKVNVGNCTQIDTYNPDGTFSTQSSSGEIMKGTYTFEKMPNLNRYKVVWYVKYDNKKTDCHGGSSDDTGVTSINYNAFQNNDKVMKISFELKGDFLPYTWFKQ